MLKDKFGEQGFKHWFVNYYWYNYKWVTLVVIAVLTVIAVMVSDALKQVRYDASVVFISSETAITQEQVDALNDIFASAIGDVNGDGKVLINYVILNTGDEQLGPTNQQKIYLCLSDSEYSLYFIDAQHAATFCAPEMEYFEVLSDYGIESDEDNPYRKSMADVPAMQRAGLDNLYLAIVDFSTVTHNSEDSARTADALDMAEVLLAAP